MAVLKRLFSLTVGLGAGVALGAWIVRRLEDARRAVTPSSLAGQAGKAAGSFANRFEEVRARARVEAAREEARLREQFGVAPLDDSDR